MKTKIIPFDLETAKKIRAGEIEGKIICNHAEAEVLAFDVYGAKRRLVVAKIKDNIGKYNVRLYTESGEDFEKATFNNLRLEVPDKEPQFKPFDKVLVRNVDTQEWWCAIFSHVIQTTEKYKYAAHPFVWTQCIPYEGNEHLVGTTDKPKDD